MADAVATSDTVSAYLTAAQTAFASGDYAEARRQITLGEMELAKLPYIDAPEGMSTTFRTSFDKILAQIDAFEKKTVRTARRLVFREAR